MSIEEKVNKYLNENIYKYIIDRGIINNILLPKSEIGRTEKVKERLKKKGYNESEINKAREKIKDMTIKLAKEMNINYHKLDKNFHGIGVNVNEPNREKFGIELKKRIKSKLM